MRRSYRRNCGFHTWGEDQRCSKCQRWRPGHKPKPVADKSIRDECQVCVNIQHLKKGKLVNHGYRRPGWGYLVGRCKGVGHLPFPETDALELHLVGVREYKAHMEGLIEDHPNTTELTTKRWTQETGYKVFSLSPPTPEDHAELDRLHKVRQEASDSKADWKTVIGPAFEAWRKQKDDIEDWAKEFASLLRKFERELVGAKQEIERVVNRIARGKKLQAKAKAEAEPKGNQLSGEPSINIGKPRRRKKKKTFTEILETALEKLPDLEPQKVSDDVDEKEIAIQNAAEEHKSARGAQRAIAALMADENGFIDAIDLRAMLKHVGKLSSPNFTMNMKKDGFVAKREGRKILGWTPGV